MSINPYIHQSQSKKTQDYFPFRSAEYQQITNHTTKLYSSNKKQFNVNRLYTRNQTNINNEENIQEYHRYRNATHHTSTRVYDFFLTEISFS
jgi:hypothetical protein